MNYNKRICVVGLGYIGLPTAAILANKGFEVIGYDINEKVVEKINKGKVHISEPDLDAFVKAAVFSGKLKAYTNPCRADIFMICVPTPLTENKEPDLKCIFKAAEDISPYLKKNDLIILESTVPVGTTEKFAELIFKLRKDLINKIYISYAPERVLPGQIIRELIENDRIIGGIDEPSTNKNKNFYENFVKGKVLTTDCRTAEFTKLVENAYRDINIAFANELSIICDKLKINVKELITLANHHPRVNILSPGIGVGGHCIAIDPYFIVYMDKKDSKLIKTARKINNYKTIWVIKKIEEVIKNFIKNYNRKPIIGCLGVTYKPDVDDIRESPALKIIEKLTKKYEVVYYDPYVQNLKHVKFWNFEKILKNTDIIIKLVAHSFFEKINSDKILIDFT